MTLPVELSLRAHTSRSCAPRTWANARRADLTVAIAADFDTAGERLTRRAAGDAYLALPLELDPIVAARRLYVAVRARRARILNVAGNGICTLHRLGCDQARINRHVFEILRPVCAHYRLESVVSGGQTGVDEAGLVAAVALGVRADGLLPAGFLRRGVDGRDVECTAADLRTAIFAGASRLLLSEPAVAG